MADATTPKAYTLDESEKATAVMVYTMNILARGEVITKEAMRVSTWLRTQSAPEFVGIYNAHVLLFGAPNGVHQSSYPEFYIPTREILAFHLAPPLKDPPDYDPMEPNRKLEPAMLQIGTFRFNGHIRMATQSRLGKYLEVARETYLSMYDVEITNPGLPSGSVLKVPMVLTRLSTAILASHKYNP